MHPGLSEGSFRSGGRSVRRGRVDARKRSQMSREADCGQGNIICQHNEAVYT